MEQLPIVRITFFDISRQNLIKNDVTKNLSNVSNDLSVFRKKTLVKSHFHLKTICHGQTIEKNRKLRIIKLHAECVVNQLDHD